MKGYSAEGRSLTRKHALFRVMVHFIVPMLSHAQVCRTAFATEMDEIKSQLIAKGLCTSISGSGSNLTTDKGNIFVKIGTGGSEATKEILEYEAEGLSRMADAAPSLHIPRPWLVGTLSNGGAFIVMEFVKQGGRKPGLMRELGRGLAEMHLAPAAHPTFGFPIDGCCGACPQLNNISQEPVNWVQFWAKYRLGDQLRMLQGNGDEKVQQLGAQLIEKLPQFFAMIDVEAIKPSLLHGDLWSGNYSADGSGNPCIFDPACYYGHHEADLGIAHMFGGFGPDFWKAYHEVIPKAPGFEQRALLYELHHHLNHYNIFGSSYRSGALSLMQQLLQS